MAEIAAPPATALGREVRQTLLRLTKSARALRKCESHIVSVVTGLRRVRGQRTAARQEYVPRTTCTHGVLSDSTMFDHFTKRLSGRAPHMCKTLGPVYVTKSIRGSAGCHALDTESKPHTEHTHTHTHTLATARTHPDVRATRYTGLQTNDVRLELLAHRLLLACLDAGRIDLLKVLRAQAGDHSTRARAHTRHTPSRAMRDLHAPPGTRPPPCPLQRTSARTRASRT